MAFDPALTSRATVRSADTRGPPSLARATRAYWWSFWLFLVAFAVGTSWDRAWHATHPFEDFYSPPHIFIYTTFALAAVNFARIVADPERRAWFGDGFRVPALKFDLPAPLALAGSGFIVIAVAGLLDDFWHTTFGLDETAWSAPHAMIGWGIILTTLGLLSCRLALRRHVPLWRLTIVFFALLVLATASRTPLGPLDNYGTKGLLAKVAALPVLARDPNAAHAFRISEQWNLTRTNPIFVPLSALTAGFALSLVHRLTRGGLLFLLAVTLVTLFSMSGDHRTAAYFHVADDARNWLPLPMLPAALIYIPVRRLTKREPLSWAAAGSVFTVLVVRWWGGGSALAIFGIPAMAVGAVAGARVHHVVESPDEAQVRALALIAFATPFALGLIDLYLRHHTA